MVEKTKQKLPNYFPMGDQALVAQFEQEVSIETSKKIQSFLGVIAKATILGVTDLLPAYNNLTICYDATLIKYDELLTIVRQLENEITEENTKQSKTIHIPVAFGGSYGQDLEEIAETTGLGVDETIQLLEDKRYFVYMIGFIAGYPYCGNIDERLKLNRRANPRAIVKKGTIQIADEQIGIITMDSPSGWHQVGWTPMEVFNPYHLPPGLLNAGDYVEFESVDIKEIENWTDESQKEWNRKWNS